MRPLKDMTQCEKVIWYIDKYGGITSLDAVRDLGVMRLASRISDLKNKHGKDIKSEFKKVKTRWGDTTQVKYYYFDKEK